MTRIRAGKASDVGLVRTNNEDDYLVADALYAVADGMGGHAGGEVASQTAIETLREEFDGARRTLDNLVAAVQAANRAVWQRAQEREELRGMGTTLTAVALIDDAAGTEELLAVVNVGDSRTYLFRSGELSQLTEDHSLVQDLVRTGQISAEEAAVHPRRNIVTRALGAAAEVEVDTWEVIPTEGDRLLLASDGLFDEVPDARIEATLRALADPDDAAGELVRLAKANGGRDNITVVVVDVVDDDDRAEEASAALAGEKSGLLSHADRDAQLRALAEADEGDDDRARAGDTWDGRPAHVGEPSRVVRRVLGSLLAMVLLAGVAVGVTAWYARASYFVALKGDAVVIYKGRPGGLLWFDPTLAERTRLTTADVLPSRLDDLRAGKVEPSLTAARAYAGNLASEHDAAVAASTTTTTTPTSTAPPASPPVSAP